MKQCFGYTESSTCWFVFLYIDQLEQAVEKELAWFKATSLGLDNLKAINLDTEVIATQLYEQKVSFFLCSSIVTYIWSKHFCEQS